MKKIVNWNVIKATIVKEIQEAVASSKITIILTIIVTNIMQLVTIMEVANQNIDIHSKQMQVGALAMYLVVMAMLFLGSTLCNNFFLDEKKNKTIHILLAMGMNKCDLWIAKNVVMMVVSVIVAFISVLVNSIAVRIIWGFWFSYTPLSLSLTFITMPIMCSGILALLSYSFWFFKKNSFLSTLFPIISYIGVWNLSMRLVNQNLNKLLIPFSFLIGLLLYLIAYILVNYISNERITQ